MPIKQIIIIISLLTICDCAKILGIFYMPSKSHHILGETLLKALAAKEHEVTMLSPFTTKNLPNNYKQLEIFEMLQYKEANMSKSILEDFSLPLWKKMGNMLHFFNALQDIFFNSTIVRNLISSKVQYDLAIVTYFGNDAVLALAQHVANHTVIFSTLGSSNLITKITKSPAPSSYVPGLFTTFPDKMSFMQRTVNFLVNTIIQVYEFFSEYKYQNFINRHFPSTPSAYEMYSNVSLVLINSDLSIESSRPYVPTMIQVGGLHIQKPKPLADNLQYFLDNAEKGAIFFSLGSNIQTSDINGTVVEELLKCFSNLPYNVLWKFEKANFKDLPKNVKISKWFPQRDILAHKNVKLFITHGGLLSTTEALYHAVPMIGIPIFGDQEANVESGVLKGYLVKLAFNDLSEKSLFNAISEVLNNSRYKENVEKRSLILRDQPMKPLDTAVYWIEYVLRHNGAHHLKTNAIKLNFYQEHLLDIITLVIVVFCIIVYSSWVLYTFLISFSKQNRNKTHLKYEKMK